MGSACGEVAGRIGVLPGGRVDVSQRRGLVRGVVRRNGGRSHSSQGCVLHDRGAHSRCCYIGPKRQRPAPPTALSGDPDDPPVAGPDIRLNLGEQRVRRLRSEP